MSFYSGSKAYRDRARSPRESRASAYTGRENLLRYVARYKRPRHAVLTLRSTFMCTQVHSSANDVPNGFYGPKGMRALGLGGLLVNDLYS